MKTAVTYASPTLLDTSDDGSDLDPTPLTVSPPGRVAAFVALTKPRIALMVLITVAVGFLLGAHGQINARLLVLTMIGTGAVAAGASVWNQVIERDRDALMNRTANRSIPAGRVGVTEAGVFGSILAVSGVALLATVAPNFYAPLVAGLTFVLYVAVYTPLKPLTTLNTAVGAIPGALPPVIGWAAATGRLGLEPFALFLIVFLWQFPHFLAIAWMHRDDYARGGHKMLPNVDPDGSMTGRQALWHAVELVPAGLLPWAIHLGGHWYFLGALALGLFYTYHAARFWWNVNDRTARRLLRASIIYLPAILLLLLIDPARPAG